MNQDRPHRRITCRQGNLRKFDAYPHKFLIKIFHKFYYKRQSPKILFVCAFTRAGFDATKYGRNIFTKIDLQPTKTPRICPGED